MILLVAPASKFIAKAEGAPRTPLVLPESTESQENKEVSYAKKRKKMQKIVVAEYSLSSSRRYHGNPAVIHAAQK
jgi:hypothetical protein